MKNIIVRNTSQIPIYQQLFDQISSQIIQGDLQPDEPLPSIRMTAKELRVSIITVKKTWEMLEQNGFIYTMVGKGSYVKMNTAGTLNKKKIDTVKEAMKETLNLCKEYGISKDELIDIIEEYYAN